MTITTKRTATGALRVRLDGERMSLDTAARVATLDTDNAITIANEHGVSYDYYGHCNKDARDRKTVLQELKDAVRSFADYR